MVTARFEDLLTIGRPGRNLVIRGSRAEVLPAMVKLALRRGDVLAIETPGGGGWGPPRE